MQSVKALPQLQVLTESYWLNLGYARVLLERA